MAFPFTFKVFLTSDLLAIQAVTVTGVETTKLLTTDYTIVLNSDQDASPGGTLTMLVAPPTDETLTITSQVPETQGVALTNAGGFYPRVINDALDRATIQIQQLIEKIGRTFTISISSGASGAVPTPVALALLGWNAAGTALQNFSGAASTFVSTFMTPVVAAVNAATARGLLGISTFMGTVVAAVDAATARGLLVAPSTSEIQAQTYTAFTTGGTATAYTLTPIPAITAYGGGQAFQVAFHAISAASPTLQISGVATPPNLVKRIGDGTLVNLAAGDIPGGSFRVLGHNATQFEVTGLPSAMAAPGNSALSGNRNRIINAACDIAQRSSIVCSVGISGYGGPDRYYTTNNGAGGQFTQIQNGTLNFNIGRFSVRQNVNTGTTSFAAGNFWFGITQQIEGFNSYDLRGKPVAISFIFNANLTGTYSVSLRDSTASQSYVTTFAAVANTPLQVKILIPAIPLAAITPLTNGLGLYVAVGTQNQGTFQTSTLNAWQAGNFLCANTSTIWAATAGNFIELTDLQLEEGTAVTPTERRSYAVELAMCSRYYESSNGSNSYVINAGTLNSFQFKVSKRASPTVLLTPNAGVISGQISDVTGVTANCSSSANVSWTAAAEL